MPNMNELEKTPRRALHIFYVLDTSGSMCGVPIATLNSAMRETVLALQDQAESNADAELKIAAMEFNSNCRWINPSGPEDIDDFLWEELSAGGQTSMGAALNELDGKLSRNSFLSSMTGAYLPVIIFMTDGWANDDYKKGLDQIRQNKWYKKATKIGFAIGDDPDVKMITEIVGDPECVIKTNDLDLFARLLKFASVTSSMLASTSRTANTPITGKDIFGSAADGATVDPSDPQIAGADLPQNQDDDDDDAWDVDAW